MRQFVIAVVWLFFISRPTFAADISLDTTPQGTTIIIVQGDLEIGDDIKFKRLAIEPEYAAVILSSAGGNAHVGVEIGRTISIKGFDTFVFPNDMCASACGLVWLAGRKRFLFPSSRVGFHSIYTNDDGKIDVSGAGNAIVGSYLQQLGLGQRVIVYATAENPSSMRWLTKTDAEAIDLSVTYLEEDETQTTGQEAAVTPRNDTASASPQQTDTSATWTILPYTDLPGHDLANMPLKLSSLPQCQAACEEAALCGAFTFNHSHQVCFLKSKADVAYQYTGATSGYLPKTSFVLRMGYDFGPGLRFRTGKDYEVTAKPFAKLQKSNLPLCQDQCVLTPSCQAFNFYPNGDCLMLSQRKPTRSSKGTISGARVD